MVKPLRLIPLRVWGNKAANLSRPRGCNAPNTCILTDKGSMGVATVFTLASLLASLICSVFAEGLQATKRTTRERKIGRILFIYVNLMIDSFKITCNYAAKQ